MINQKLFELLCNLPVAVPPETEVILKVTSLSISPSVMVAHTSLKASFSLGVVYSLSVKAIVIPAFVFNISTGVRSERGEGNTPPLPSFQKSGQSPSKPIALLLILLGFALNKHPLCSQISTKWAFFEA